MFRSSSTASIVVRRRSSLTISGLAAMLAATLLCTPSPAAAQAVTGTLLGNITDASGAAVPGATVTATELQTNTSRTTVSNETGHYTFSSLRNGTYSVTAELQGFRKVIRQNVQVDVNTTLRVDLTLELGQMSEAVTVAAETPLLQTDRTDTGRILESKMVTEIPLGFNRNFQGLLVTVPGATRPFRPHSQFFNSQDALGTEINGQPRMANNTLIEGLDNNHKTGLMAVIIPAPDALETVSVSTSNYDAEFGRSGGAVTNVTLKSGTNNTKGSGFFFGNTEATIASDYLTHLKAPTKFAQGGFTLGGPILRNKLFYFGDYQRTIDNLGYVVRATIPTMAMRNGDFSAVPNGIYDPLTGAVNGAGRTAFANNQVPQDRISPIARQLIGFLPEPNIPNATLGQNNFQKAQTREKTTDAFDTKINYTMSDKNQLSGRLSFMRPVVFDPGPYGEIGGPANDGFAGTGTNTSTSTAANWTRVFSSTLVMDVRGGVNYYHNVAVSQGSGLRTSADVGIPGVEHRRLHERAHAHHDWRPHLAGPRLREQPAVGSIGRDVERRHDGHEAPGNHTLKLGGEWRHNRDMLLQTQDAGGSRGLFNFTSSGTANPADSGSTTSLANSFAVVPAGLAGRRQPRSQGHRRARHAALGDVPLRARQVAGTVERHRRSRAAVGVLQPAARARRRGQPLELRPGDQRASRGRVRGHERRGEREEHVQQLQPADGRVLAAQREVGRAGGIRGEHDSLPGQSLRVQLPGQAELLGHLRRRIPARRHDGGRLPRSCAVHDSLRRDHSCDRITPQLDLRRHHAWPAGRHAALLERRVPASAAVPSDR